MASDQPQPTRRVEAAPVIPEDPAIILHVISPSTQVAQRYTFKDLPLSTTVWEMKARLSATVPGQPDPQSQRLIYKGRVLVNSEVLENIVDPLATHEHSMHLMLPPNRIPIPTPTIDNTITPPTPPPESIPAGNPAQNTTGLRYRGSQTDAARANLRNYLRDCAAALENTTHGVPDYTLQQQAAATAAAAPPTDGASSTQSSSTNIHPQTQPTQTRPVPSGDHDTQAADAAFQAQFIGTAVPEEPQPQVPGTLGSGRRQRLGSLLQRILAMETQVWSGTIPSVEEISTIRFQLHQLLDEQYQNPHSPREAPLEAWLARLSSIAIRADHLRAAAGNPTAAAAAAAASTSTSSRAPVYLLSSPSGPYGLIFPPETVVPGIHPPQQHHVPAFGHPIHGAAVNYPPIHQALRPGFRIGLPAVMQQQQRQTILSARNLVHITRGVWLFVRLYFFCYLMTRHGSWMRTISMVLSALISILAQTNVPQQARALAWDPIRRHLENLVPLDAGQQARPARPGQANAAATAPNLNPNPAPTAAPPIDLQRPPPEPTAAAVLRQNMMRAERAIALFLATLVPGIGERYVAVRNAAETARQRAEEEIQQQQGGEGEGEAGREDGPLQPENIDVSDDTDSSDTTTDRSEGGSSDRPSPSSQHVRAAQPNAEDEDEWED